MVGYGSPAGPLPLHPLRGARGLRRQECRRGWPAPRPAKVIAMRVIAWPVSEANAVLPDSETRRR